MSVWLSRRLVLLLLRRIKVGSLIVVEGDERLVFGSGSTGCDRPDRLLADVADAAARQPRDG